jgi:cell division septal protein FtsQ
LPFVEKVEFEREFPDTLNIVVTDAKEFACYSIGESYYTVSESGWTLSKYDELPENVTLIKAKGVKCKVGTEIKFSNEKKDEVPKLIIQLLNQYKIPINYVDVTNSLNLTAKVNDQFVVNFGTTTDLEYKVKHLKTMMKEIGEKKTGNIDLSVWNSQNTQGFFVQNNIK